MKDSIVATYLDTDSETERSSEDDRRESFVNAAATNAQLTIRSYSEYDELNERCKMLEKRERIQEKRIRMEDK